jgi:hypothetical protein
MTVLCSPLPPVANWTKSKEGYFERPGLCLCVSEQWRSAAKSAINVPRDRRSAPRNQARQRQPQNRRQTQDGRIAKQVVQKRLHRADLDDADAAEAATASAGLHAFLTEDEPAAAALNSAA